MADGDDSKVEIYTPAGPNVFVDNEKFTGTAGEVERQRVSDLDAQMLLREIAYYLASIASKASDPNKLTGAQRVELLAGSATVGSISTVAGVTNLANITSIGGVAAGPGQLGLSGLAAAAIRSKITVTP